ncbi:hypothetical protein Fcan01_16517 [Folsomia candida]|uniref:DUF5641 domain-containing protein n=1 Tax=Folsomia candida TaxID=158441 RepID=A0A226DTM3_FOLCA|nr:hypothetical protein Fcan01_16517 [Folsomia candida]
MPLKDRREEAASKGLCFNCLNPGHGAKFCKSTQRCGVEDCNLKHHALLHSVEFRPPRNHPRNQSPNEVNGTVNGTVNGIVNSTANGTSTETVNAFTDRADSTRGYRGVLGIVKVKLTGQRGSKEVYTLVDPGATTGLIDDDVAKQIGLDGPKISMCIKGVESTGQPVESKLVKFKLAGSYPGARTYQMNYVKTLPGMDMGTFSFDLNQAIRSNPRFNGIPLKSYKDVKPKLLIGNDHIFLTEHLKIIGGRVNQPRAYKSRLGWYVSGVLGQRNQSTESVYDICYGDSTAPDSTAQDSAIHEMMKVSFSTEDFVVKTIHERPRSREDERAMKILAYTTSMIPFQDKCQTGLLWKVNGTKFPVSDVNALRRLRCQERTMDKNPVIGEAYYDKINEYEQKKFVQKLRDSTVVLCTPTNYDRKFRTCVAHRISEILDILDTSEWSWVPTKENPADDATRDSVEADLTPRSRWLNGPKFLRLSPDRWPTESKKIQPEDLDADELEMKIEVHAVEISTAPTDIGINIDEFDDLTNPLTASAKTIRTEVNDWSKAEELDKSKMYWLKRSQQQKFLEGIHILNRGKLVPIKSRIVNLGPILKKGMSRMTRMVPTTRLARPRGAPECKNCDNGTDFGGEAKELQAIIEQLKKDDFKRHAVENEIQWHFTLPASPHMEGVRERLLGSVKMRSGKFNGTIPIMNLQMGEFSDDDLILRKQWRKAQRIADMFWTRWIKEYLPTLAKRSKWHKTHKSINVGDPVIIEDDQAPRNNWQQGEVVEVYPGRDGVIRVADVRISEGHIYQSPFVKLCILETTPATEEDISTK